MRISEDVSGKVGTGRAAGCVLHVCSLGLLQYNLHPAAVYLREMKRWDGISRHLVSLAFVKVEFCKFSTFKYVSPRQRGREEKEIVHRLCYLEYQ